MKQERISNGIKTVSAAHGAGKTGQPHGEEFTWTIFLHHIQKNKLKMDETPNRKTGIHPNPPEKTGNNLFEPQPQQLLTCHVSRGKGNKSKNELLGPHQHKKLLQSKGNNQQN